MNDKRVPFEGGQVDSSGEDEAFRGGQTATAEEPETLRVNREPYTEACTPYEIELVPAEAAHTLCVDHIVALERTLAEHGTPLDELMRRAGAAVAHIVSELSPSPVPVAILCGKGNNGGDGWVTALLLAEASYPATVISIDHPSAIAAQPAADVAQGVYGRLVRSPYAMIVIDPSPEDVRSICAHADIVIDALLGTGFTGDAIREPYAAWIEAVNGLSSIKDGPTVIAVDVPSGLDAQTGNKANPCIKAYATVTMLAMKPGLGGKVGKETCGITFVARIADIAEFISEQP